MENQDVSILEKYGNGSIIGGVGVYFCGQYTTDNSENQNSLGFPLQCLSESKDELDKGTTLTRNLEKIFCKKDMKIAAKND